MAGLCRAEHLLLRGRGGHVVNCLHRLSSLTVPASLSSALRISKNPVHKCLRATSCQSLRKMSSDPQQPTSASPPPDVDIGPGTWREIYHGILATQIKMVKTFSLSTSMMGLAMQPILAEKMLGTHLGVVVAVGSFVGFFTLVTPFLIHWVTKKYVTSLEYNPDKDIYSATTVSFFLREKKLHFRVEDVKVPEVPGMFTTFLVKSHPLFVDPRMFQDVEHFGRLMGYDKPIDFHLRNTDGEK